MLSPPPKAVSLEGVEVDVGSLGGKGQHRLVFLKRILRVKIVRIRWHDLEVWRALQNDYQARFRGFIADRQ
jgi:hypothetical protein